MAQPVGTLSEEVREAVVARLERAPVSLAVLFGSYATDDATEGSDIDIAVNYDTESERVTESYVSLVADLTRILGRDDIDVVRLSAVDPRIAVDALKRGELLVGSAADADRLRERFEHERRQHEERVRSRIADAERTIEQRIEQREYGG